MKTFTEMTTSEIEAFLIEHCGELDMSLDPGDVCDRVTAGRAVIERRSYGFAIVQLAPVECDPGKFTPYLWAIYVDQSLRGHGTGHRFMREIMRKYSRDYHLSLYCTGSRRRKFFGRLGFRIESREGEYRRMTTNDYI